jgi:hypothetical protein
MSSLQDKSPAGEDMSTEVEESALLGTDLATGGEDVADGMCGAVQ